MAKYPHASLTTQECKHEMYFLSQKPPPLLACSLCSSCLTLSFCVGTFSGEVIERFLCKRRLVGRKKADCFFSKKVWSLGPKVRLSVLVHKTQSPTSQPLPLPSLWRVVILNGIAVSANLLMGVGLGPQTSLSWNFKAAMKRCYKRTRCFEVILFI